MILSQLQQMINSYAAHIDKDAVTRITPEGLVIESMQVFIDGVERMRLESLGFVVCQDETCVMIPWSSLR